MGWSQENVAFVLGSYIIVIGLSNIKKFIKYSIKEKILIISSIILFGIGALLLGTSNINIPSWDNLPNWAKILSNFRIGLFPRIGFSIRF